MTFLVTLLSFMSQVLTKYSKLGGWGSLSTKENYKNNNIEVLNTKQHIVRTGLIRPNIL